MVTCGVGRSCRRARHVIPIAAVPVSRWHFRGLYCSVTRQTLTRWHVLAIGCATTRSWCWRTSSASGEETCRRRRGVRRSGGTSRSSPSCSRCARCCTDRLLGGLTESCTAVRGEIRRGGDSAWWAHAHARLSAMLKRETAHRARLHRPSTTGRRSPPLLEGVDGCSPRPFGVVLFSHVAVNAGLWRFTRGMVRDKDQGWFITAGSPTADAAARRKGSGRRGRDHKSNTPTGT